MRNYKTLTAGWVVLAFVLTVWCIGCGSGGTATSDDDDDFELSSDAEMEERKEALRLLLPEATYNAITAGSRNNASCKEGNRADFDDFSELPNSEWYYTYENLITAMARWKEFASEGNENTRKLEIAAFLANVAQETGAKGAGDPYGGPGCFIQEVEAWLDPARYNSAACGVSYVCAAAGYYGRGPHQLSWDSNYKAFSEDMGAGDEYFTNPDMLTTDPDIGMAGSIWFWGHEEYTEWSPRDPDIPFKPSAHNVLVGDWTPTTATTPGVRTSNDVKCDRTAANFGIIINIINGGVECGPTATDEGRVNAQNRVNYLGAIAEAMGVDIPAGFSNNCADQQNFNCPSY